MQRVLLDARAAMASPNRTARSAVVTGRLLGIAFLVCFVTGVYSHLLQEPLGWMRFPTRPVQLYQVTQGLHVTAGIAAIPLLLAKLNVVMPALVQTPPVRNVLHLLERLSIAVFVAAALIQVVTGLLNTFQWYPWPFPFRQVHNALAYVIIGSLAVHIGTKLRIITRYWRQRDSVDGHGRFVVDRTVGSELPDPGREARPESVSAPRGFVGRLHRWIDGAPSAAATGPDRAAPDRGTEADPVRTDGADADRASRPESGSGPGSPRPDDRAAAADGARHRVARRGFIAGVTAATAGVVVLTAGQSSVLAEPFNVFAPRKRHIGQNGLPVNRTARAAGVLATATAADWALTVAGPAVSRTFSRAELVALGQAEARLPISCVEGWSQMASWKGVRMRDLLAAVQSGPDVHVRVTSLERNGSYRVMEMGPEYTADPTTLVALELNGEKLDLEHGFPARIIAPGRPGVLQTKWIERIEVIQ
ncbi:molybdopterin-dependent oxidoreductase [Curtobacterium sp. MCSS17_015]|uniref:molybdopterin-dependent oxidoreductase n=1 Tax=Curtobacterium sp. MCSS17_015 TaxID=2175666 RepID=UPI0015E89B10|nr:molybdopterin-dependent oxidoreductase [Curtobacterium sp. MCSS17_015]WIB25872.1 molybdopterin-dependent oxidoreductase [Curtobacterium sp. MCSS17_015]